MLTTAVANTMTTAFTTVTTDLGRWGGPGWGGPGGHGFGPGGGGFGWLLLLIPLFWVGVFVLVFSLAARRRRRFWAANGGALGQGGFGHPGWARPGWGGSGGPHAWAGGEPAGWAAPSAAVNPAADAEKTLAGRFAVGDIDEVEYRARLEVLRANRPVDPTPNGS